jgi:hypothetical protein
MKNGRSGSSISPAFPSIFTEHINPHFADMPKAGKRGFRLLSSFFSGARAAKAEDDRLEGRNGQIAAPRSLAAASACGPSGLKSKFINHP